MTSLNNSIKRNKGSALIITILLLSVMLSAAMILLQRIVPYAKSVRSMHDASQAYYVARGQADLARLQFLYNLGGQISNNTNINFGPAAFFQFLGNIGDTTIEVRRKGKRESVHKGRSLAENLQDDVMKEVTPIGTNKKEISIALPFINISTNAQTNLKEAFAVSSGSSEVPLKIKPAPNDTDTKNFGTSKIDPTSHTLYSRNASGLRFDLRGVNMSVSDFTLGFKPTKIGTPYHPATAAWNITLKIQYLGSSPTDTLHTFTAEYTGDKFPTDGVQTKFFTADLVTLGNIQLIDTSGGITSISGVNLGDFLKKIYALPGGVTADTIDCTNATICSLSLILNSPTPNAIDFQLSSSVQIPDLNAVSIGDGLSDNGLYYQRVIDLIPTPQNI